MRDDYLNFLKMGSENLPIHESFAWKKGFWRRCHGFNYWGVIEIINFSLVKWLYYPYRVNLFTREKGELLVIVDLFNSTSHPKAFSFRARMQEKKKKTK